MKLVFVRQDAPPVLLHRSGQEVALNQGKFRYRFGVRSSPLAALFVELFSGWLEREPRWTAEEAMRKAAWELECAIYASNRRRFRRCFAGAA